MEFNLPVGYKCEFKPSLYDTLRIVKDIAKKGDQSIHKHMLRDVNMYHISFIEKLAIASPAIEVNNQHLVRSRSQKVQCFASTVAGCIGGHWTPNGYPVVIIDPVGLDAGYCRELQRGGEHPPDNVGILHL
nr:hypothetical protein [Tanacetum cinerariifolium]